MKILNVVGARPNFIKIAPLIREMRRHPQITPILVHTGQHYDADMAGQFFEDLEIPNPDFQLGVGAGSHAYQTAEVMKRLEPILERERPQVVVVVGDVNSTMAGALAAAKLQLSVAHVEAGLRSFDRSMPEEINRVVTDAVSDILFASEDSGVRNLMAEGVPPHKIFFVGNVMIDSLMLSHRRWIRSTIHDRLGLPKGRYGILTLHRPANVDDPDTLKGLLSAVGDIADLIPIVFPVHPRTRRHLETAGERSLFFRSQDEQAPERGLFCVPPLGYLDFMALLASARFVLTDSGGIQEETTALGVPCMTLRHNTERPVTVSHGTNRLVGVSPDAIVKEAERILRSPLSNACPPPLWDGRASRRIVDILLDRFHER
ncbi:MAG: UDP-N-acetylglucosamine 2-epimerase (non-hydrolyzing) [Nitrospirota bacterium]